MSAKLRGALLFEKLSKSLFKQLAEFYGMNQTTNASSQTAPHKNDDTHPLKCHVLTL